MKEPTMKIVSKNSCPFCDKAKSLLDRYNIPYDVVDITRDEATRQIFLEQGFKTVPQIWNGDHHIGGYEDLCDYVIEEGLINL